MDKAFMGISIRNPFYSKKDNILKAISLAKNFSEFIIFPVDYPYRISLEVFDNLDKKEALGLALKEGEELTRFLSNLSKSFPYVRVRFWKELESKEYQEFLKEIIKLENKDENFSGLILNEFSGKINEELKELPKENYLRNSRLCKEFIMEEIAMFSYLTSIGYTTRISKYNKSKAIDYFLLKKGLSLNHLKLTPCSL